MTNIKIFWNNKILRWENSRYFNNSISLNEKIASIFSNSLFARREILLKLIKDKIKNKNIIEIGCGSGLLCNKIISHGAKSYFGIDFSSNAIERAKKINLKYIKSNQATFSVIEVAKLKSIKQDLILSLGLIDWLNNDDLLHLSKISKNKLFIHSFSRKKVSFSQYIHKIYVFFSYKNKTTFYPKYLTRKKILNIFKNVNFYQNKKLNFGEFFFNFNL